MWWRYGSLEDFSCANMKKIDVAKHMYLPWMTVHNVLTKFINGNKRLQVFDHVDRRFGKIPDDVKQFLLEKQTLQAWSPFSLYERVEIIRRVLGIQTSYSTLRRFYKSNRITFQTAKQVYRNYLVQQPQLDVQRRQFAVILANLIKKKTPLIYQDETTCNSFMAKKKSWSTRRDVNVHHRNNERHSCTVFGAIGDCLKDGVVWMIHVGRNLAEDYQRFLVKVRGAVKSSVTQKCVLLYDGAGTHRSDDSVKICAQHFIPLESVPHSCDFNSIVSSRILIVDTIDAVGAVDATAAVDTHIYCLAVQETLWSIAKNNLEKLLLLEPQEITKEQFYALVEQSLKMVSRQALQGILKSNRGHIAHYLQN